MHDLARRGNFDGVDHGKRAVESNIEEVEKIITQPTELESCLNAIEMHSMDDKSCPIKKRDGAWEILKDADGLDRGRFNRPDNELGCNPKLLRLSYLSQKDIFCKNVPWMAYQLAGMTKYIFWNESPSELLASKFCYAISAGYNKAVFLGDSKATAFELLSKMENII